LHTRKEARRTGLATGGANRVEGISFFVADPTKLRQEARLKAVVAAREKATAMAAELGQTIGKPWEITEEPEEGRTYIAANYLVAGRLPQQEEQTIAGGQVTIRASVRVSFELE